MARKEDFVPNGVVVGGHFISQGFQLRVWICDKVRLIDVDVVGGEVHTADFTTNNPAWRWSGCFEGAE